MAKSLILTLIVPVLNEEQNITGAIKEIHAACKALLVPRYEILVVDDGSTDNSAATVADLISQDPKIRLLQHSRNHGLGAAYRTGVKNARGVYTLMVPGDNAHPAQGIVPILEQMGKADIVIPYASNPEVRTRFRQLLSKAFVGFFNMLFGLKIPYYNGLVLHRTELVRTVQINTDGFTYQAEALVKLLKAGASFTTIGVVIAERQHGTTRALRVRNIVKALSSVVYLYTTVRLFKTREMARLKQYIKEL